METLYKLKYLAVIVLISISTALVCDVTHAEYFASLNMHEINKSIENLEWKKAESLLLQRLWSKSTNSLETIERFVQVCIYLHKAPLGMEWLEKTIVNTSMTDDQKIRYTKMLKNLQKIYLPDSEYKLTSLITSNNIDLDNPKDIVIADNGDLIVMDRYRLITLREQSPCNYQPVPPTSPLPEDIQSLKLVNGKPVIITRNGYFLDHRVKHFSNTHELTRIIDASFSNKGFWLIIDRRYSTLLRFDVDGKMLESFPVPALAGDEKIIRNNFGGCWILNPTSRRIITAGSKIEIQIPFKGPGYILNEPVDMTTDWFGHLYVLDKDNSVTIFSPSGIRLRRLILDQNKKFLKEASAIAVRDDGQIFIADRKKHAINCYY